MKLGSDIAVGVVAFLHTYFFVLETFLWRTRLGRRVFGHTREQGEATYVLMQNQGVYNLFLAAGLCWALVSSDPALALGLKTFFLSCVVVAGLVGAVTANWRILLVQSLPAGVGLALSWL